MVRPASQNPLRAGLLRLANQWTAGVREFSHATEQGRRDSHRGHQVIFEAIRRGDGEAARAAMLAHLADVATLTRDAYPAR